MRLKGEGSVYQRKDGRWIAAVSVPGSGTRQRYFRTADAAVRGLQKLRSDGGAGLASQDGTQTVATYLGAWLETVKPSLRPRVWTRYEQHIRLHAVPTIGKHRLTNLRPVHLQALYAAELAAGSHPSSVHHLHAVLHRALHHAVRWELLPRNPADSVDPPPLHPERRPTLTAEEVGRLLAVEGSHRLGAAVTVAVTTGMRHGEIMALRWQDVDLDAGTVTIMRSLARVKGSFVFMLPKTASSSRQIRIPDIAVEALARRRRQQLEERLAAGPLWQDQGLVFTDIIGQPLHHQTVWKATRVMLETAGLPRVRFHDLRHTFATLALGAHIFPRVVQEALGHSGIAITQNLYSHVTPVMKGELAQAMDRVLRSSTVKSTVKND